MQLTKEQSEKLRVLSNDLRKLRSEDLQKHQLIDGLNKVAYQVLGIRDEVQLRKENNDNSDI